MAASRKLQVKTASGWEYVFSRNAQNGKVVTTKTKTKALGGQDALEYFRAKCANDTFRLEASKKKTANK